MQNNVDKVSAPLALLIVLWPVGLWLIEFCVYLLVRLNGCTLSAVGPQECLILGADIGEHVYPLWSLGFQLI